MNGPQHYAEAERLLEFAEYNRSALHQQYVAEAQVHATLALAAATAEAGELCLKPVPNSDPWAGDIVAYPGNDWGRAIHGELEETDR